MRETEKVMLSLWAQHAVREAGKGVLLPRRKPTRRERLVWRAREMWQRVQRAWAVLRGDE